MSSARVALHAWLRAWLDLARLAKPHVIRRAQLPARLPAKKKIRPRLQEAGARGSSSALDPHGPMLSRYADRSCALAAAACTPLCSSGSWARSDTDHRRAYTCIGGCLPCSYARSRHSALESTCVTWVRAAYQAAADCEQDCACVYQSYHDWASEPSDALGCRRERRRAQPRRL